MLEVLFLRTI